jgi:ABC-2 type transport system permease protein
MVIILAFFLADKVLLYMPGAIAPVVEYLGIDYHFSNIARGVIDSRDIIYFGSVLGFALMTATASLERRKW